MRTISTRLSTTIAAAALTGFAALSAAPVAQAAGRDGSCDAGEFCYYYNSNLAGSVSDFTTSVGDYGTSQPTCYVFKGPGSGQGQCIKNNSASVRNLSSQTVRVYYNSNYAGSYQDIAPNTSAQLNSTLYNQNASHQFLSAPSTGGSYPAKDDYPYRGQSGVDPWNFYKGQCTSFAAWAVRSRVGIDFSNYYKGAHWGNATHWDDAARSVGVPVYGSPRAGDVAVRQGGTYGHVAFVTRVNSNGTFEIDEYNYVTSERYSHRTVSVGTGNSQFSAFIRFK